MDQSPETVTRGDFDRFATELRTELAEALVQSMPVGRHDVLSDVLGQLRILKWGAGFALAAIMGAFGVLYQGQVDLRLEMRSEIAGLREEMQREFRALRQEISSLAERVARLEAGHTYILGRFEEWSSSRSIGPDTPHAPGDAPARAESGS